MTYVSLSSKWAERPSPARERTDHQIDPWSVRLAAEPSAPRLARRALDRLSEHLGWESMENLRLLATELVTNSVVHGGSGAIHVHAHLLPDLVVVLITDEGAGFDPLGLTGSRPGVPGGRGLELVALLADGLGIDCRNPFRVWFSISR